jgi:streptogramin lyase
VSEFSNAGIPLSPSSGYTGGGISANLTASSFNLVAIDGAGNVWIGDNGGFRVVELSNSGAAISPSTGYLEANHIDPLGIAIDGSGNVWFPNYLGETVSELIGAATPVITPISAGLPLIPTTDGSSRLGTRP